MPGLEVCPDEMRHTDIMLLGSSPPACMKEPAEPSRATKHTVIPDVAAMPPIAMELNRAAREASRKKLVRSLQQHLLTFLEQFPDLGCDLYLSLTERTSVNHCVEHHSGVILAWNHNIEAVAAALQHCLGIDALAQI